MLEFDPLERLRERTSAKWRAFDPGVLPAFVAELDVELAEPVARALHDAIDRSDTGYRWTAGVPEALAGFAQRTWGWTVDPGQVVVVPDVMAGVAQAIMTLTQTGDAVVVNPPVYPPFFSTIRTVTDRAVVEVPMRLGEAGYALDLDALDVAFARPDVTAFLLCSPHNPTGTVPSAQELASVARLAREHQVAVISDEIHAPLAHPGVVHTPFLTVAPPGLDAVVVTSASKAWNVAGLKCAQVVASSPELARRIEERMPAEVSYETGHLGVLAAVAAYEQGGPWLDELRRQLAHNAAHVVDTIERTMPGVQVHRPQASYLAWLDCTGLELGVDPAEFFLEHARVALTAARPFRPRSPGFVRLNFGTGPHLLDEILARLATAVNERAR